MTHNIDDLTFGEALEYSRRNSISEITWRGMNYEMDNVHCVTAGFARQALIGQRALADLLGRDNEKRKEAQNG